MKTKCDKENCCEHLVSRLAERGAGFYTIMTVNLNSKVGGATAKFRGVCYKTSAKDKGLMLNWCPFCGGQPGDFKRLKP